jgi:tetratricopeptide (TPR) repeat protein
MTETIIEKLHPKWYLPKSELMEMFDLNEYKDTDDECLLGMFYEKGIFYPESFEKAEEYYLKAIDKGKQLEVETGIKTGISVTNLGELYHRHGRYDDAVRMYKALAECEDITVFDKLIEVYIRLDKYSEAEECCMKAIELSYKYTNENYYPDCYTDKESWIKFYTMIRDNTILVLNDIYFNHHKIFNEHINTHIELRAMKKENERLKQELEEIKLSESERTV